MISCYMTFITLWLCNKAMEHGPFIDGLAIKNDDEHVKSYVCFHMPSHPQFLVGKITNFPCSLFLAIDIYHHLSRSNHPFFYGTTIVLAKCTALLMTSTFVLVYR